MVWLIATVGYHSFGDTFDLLIGIEIATLSVGVLGRSLQKYVEGVLSSTVRVTVRQRLSMREIGVVWLLIFLAFTGLLCSLHPEAYVHVDATVRTTDGNCLE